MFTYSSLTGHDLERESRPLEPIIAEEESAEVAVTSLNV
jgi:hypothetical protein